MFSFFPRDGRCPFFGASLSRSVHAPNVGTAGQTLFSETWAAKVPKNLQLQRASSQSPILEMKHASFFSHGNFPTSSIIVWRKLWPIWSHLELWSFRSVYDLIQTHDWKLFKKTEMLSVNMLFLPRQVVGTGFRTVLVLFASDSICVLRTSTPKHPPSREAAWNCYQNKTMDSKTEQMMPTACLCVYIYIIYTLYTSFVISPKGFHPIHFLTALWLSATKLPGPNLYNCSGSQIHDTALLHPFDRSTWNTKYIWYSTPGLCQWQLSCGFCGCGRPDPWWKKGEIQIEVKDVGT